MSNDRTRTFKGKYISDDERVYHINVRIFKRLATFGLEINLNRCGLDAISKKNEVESSTKPTLETSTFAEDEQLVEKIVTSKPHIINDVVDISYCVKEGDTIESIAEAFGMTVERLCYLNNLKKDAQLYPGGMLKVEKVTAKSELDKQIAAGESYFYDYLFKSPLATLVLSHDKKGYSEQMNYYEKALFGEPKTNNEVDGKSIYGEYIKNYMTFHEGHAKDDEKTKKDYAEHLANLSARVSSEINLNGTINAVMPFDMYVDYLQNGPKKMDETKEK